jgi:hypothetical protein
MSLTTTVTHVARAINIPISRQNRRDAQISDKPKGRHAGTNVVLIKDLWHHCERLDPNIRRAGGAPVDFAQQPNGLGWPNLTPVPDPAFDLDANLTTGIAENVVVAAQMRPDRADQSNIRVDSCHGSIRHTQFGPARGRTGELSPRKRRSHGQQQACKKCLFHFRGFAAI